MDSLTQLALGSAVCVAVMGRRTAAWKATLWGAVAGTLPDLDALIDHGDALLNMVLHRAESHALLYLSIAAPVLAWMAARGHHFLRWWLALWLVLITHPLLDTMTIYGTQLLLPFTNHPFGLGSVFIIDPAYTLPLIVGVVAAVRCKDAVRGLHWNRIGLALSTLYLGWSLVAQHHIEQQARASLREIGVSAQRVLVTPTPLQTLLWRVVAIADDPADPVFHEAYVSVLDEKRPLRWTTHARGSDLLAQHAAAPPVARLSAFTHGFVKAAVSPQGQLRITDLRMGQEPDYVFSFDLGPLHAVGQTPATQVSSRPPIGPALRWIGQRMLGHDIPPPWLKPPA
ncbi:MAG: metal-dependent hydrolase [Rhodoferax sp.]|nr:metal-dependent hydrolase [Rhodoferax sp.]